MVTEPDGELSTIGDKYMIEVEDSVVKFESLSEYWNKERAGRKSNTVRNFTAQEIIDQHIEIYFGRLYMRGGRITHIIMTNTQTKESFRRELTDVAAYKNLLIFSWRHTDDSDN